MCDISFRFCHPASGDGDDAVSTVPCVTSQEKTAFLRWFSTMERLEDHLYVLHCLLPSLRSLGQQFVVG